MSSIDELLASPIQLAGVNRREPKWEIVSDATVYPERKNRDGQFENEVFEYLFLNRASLGIAEVRRARNQKIDGAITLESGLIVPIEIKFRMNWEKACQASWQVSRYYEMRPSEVRKIGIVIFEEFSGDWDNKPKYRDHKYGWIRWYSEHVRDNGMELHLAQLNQGTFQLGPP